MGSHVVFRLGKERRVGIRRARGDCLQDRKVGLDLGKHLRLAFQVLCLLGICEVRQQVALDSKGSQSKFFAKVYLQTGFVLIPKGYVKWSKPPGIFGFLANIEPFSMEEAFEVLGFSKKGT